MYKSSILKGLLLAYLYYCIINIFPYDAQLLPTKFIGDSIASTIAFYLLYLLYINSFQLFFVNSMYLVRSKNIYHAIMGVIYRLLPLNLLYSIIFVSVINLVNWRAFNEIDLIYSLQFFILINISMVLLNLVLVTTHILFGVVVSFISSFFLIVLNIFAILYQDDASDFSYLPLSLHAVSVTRFLDALVVAGVFLCYLLVIFGSIKIIRGVHYGNKKKIQ